MKTFISKRLLLGLVAALPALAAAPDTSETAFRGSCSARSSDANGTWIELGRFNLVIWNPKEDCPHQVFSLAGLEPKAKGNDIYVEYQGSNASPKIFMNDELFGYNDIRLYGAQVGNHLMAELTTKSGREVVCSGDVVFAGGAP